MGCCGCLLVMAPVRQKESKAGGIKTYFATNGGNKKEMSRASANPSKEELTVYEIDLENEDMNCAQPKSKANSVNMFFLPKVHGLWQYLRSGQMLTVPLSMAS